MASVSSHSSCAADGGREAWFDQYHQEQRQRNDKFIQRMYAFEMRCRLTLAARTAQFRKDLQNTRRYQPTCYYRGGAERDSSSCGLCQQRAEWINEATEQESIAAWLERQLEKVPQRYSNQQPLF